MTIVDWLTIIYIYIWYPIYCYCINIIRHSLTKRAVFRIIVIIYIVTVPARLRKKAITALAPALRTRGSRARKGRMQCRKASVLFICNLVQSKLSSSVLTTTSATTISLSGIALLFIIDPRDRLAEAQPTPARKRAGAWQSNNIIYSIYYENYYRLLSEYEMLLLMIYQPDRCL